MSISVTRPVNRVVVVRDPENTVTVNGGSTNTVIERSRANIDVTQVVKPIEINQVGLQGPAGQDGDKHYKHIQSTASATWVVTHNLNKFPSVVVVDSGGTAVGGSLEYINENELVLRFTTAFGGTAYLN